MTLAARALGALTIPVLGVPLAASGAVAATAAQAARASPCRRRWTSPRPTRGSGCATPHAKPGVLAFAKLMVGELRRGHVGLGHHPQLQQRDHRALRGPGLGLDARARPSPTEKAIADSVVTLAVGPRRAGPARGHGPPVRHQVHHLEQASMWRAYAPERGWAAYTGSVAAHRPHPLLLHLGRRLRPHVLVDRQAVTTIDPGPPAPTPTTAPTTPSAVYTVLVLGSTGADVALAQRVIGVAADGQFGPITLAALRAWQAANGVPGDRPARRGDVGRDGGARQDPCARHHDDHDDHGGHAGTRLTAGPLRLDDPAPRLDRRGRGGPADGPADHGRRAVRPADRRRRASVPDPQPPSRHRRRRHHDVACAHGRGSPRAGDLPRRHGPTDPRAGPARHRRRPRGGDHGLHGIRRGGPAAGLERHRGAGPPAGPGRPGRRRGVRCPHGCCGQRLPEGPPAHGQRRRRRPRVEGPRGTGLPAAGPTARRCCARARPAAWSLVLQRALGVAADGRFGPRTEAAVKALQGRAKIARTGVVASVTWQALEAELRRR